MPSNLSNYDAVLKEHYEDYICDQLNNQVTLLNILERLYGMYTGRRVILSARNNRNWGIGARPDGGTLPASQNQTYTQMAVTAKYNYGRIAITGPTISASANDSGAFASAVETEIEGMILDLANDINRQLYNDGTGRLCLINAPAATYADSETVQVDTPGARHVKPGMLIDIGLLAGATQISSVTVVAVDNSDNIIELGAAQTYRDNDLVTLLNSKGYEMMGLLGIVDDGTVVATFQLVERSGTSNPWLDGNVMNGPTVGTGRALTLDLMQQAFDRASEAGGGRIDYIIGHYAVRREYLAVLTPDIRYTPMKLEGGFDTLTYAGGDRPVPFIFDKHATVNQTQLTTGTNIASIYFLDSSTLKVYVQKDFHWSDETGSILRPVADIDQFEAFIKYYAELGCKQPNANTVLNDITISGLPVVDF